MANWKICTYNRFHRQFDDNESEFMADYAGFVSWSRV